MPKLKNNGPRPKFTGSNIKKPSVSRFWLNSLYFILLPETQIFVHGFIQVIGAILHLVPFSHFVVLVSFCFT